MTSAPPPDPAFAPGANRGLQPGAFRCVALNGIGDGANSYPHGMAWYGEHLYVATTRLVFQLLYYVSHKETVWKPYPVKVDERNPYTHLDARGQIWRFHPPTNVWEKVLVAEWMPPKNGVRFPYFNGIRNMVEFHAKGDSRTALYMPTMAPKGGPEPMILRTEDGLNYERIELTGAAAKRFNTFRPMVNFKGRLWIAPTGKTGSGSAAGTALVMASDDPARTPWQQCNETNFGDPHNEGIFEMTEFAGHLYAGTVNPEGFQLWKTDGENFPNCRWTRVLTRGGGRGCNNQAVGSLKPFKGALYIGASIINGGYDRNHGIGPAAAELLRVHPDDTWDLVMGEGRLTDQGLKMPLSGLSAGFDNPFNTYVWRMGVHDGWLYAGTFSTAGVVQYFAPEKFSERVRRIMDRDRVSLLAEKLGGCALWRSRDGVIWIPVTTTGFGNPFNYGIRALISSPYGLFVGTANPFGPDVAVHRASGWQYETNPRGGLEVWLGTHDHLAATVDRSLNVPTPIAAASVPDFEPEGLSDEERRQRCVDQALETFFRHPRSRLFGYWKRETKTADRAATALLEEVASLLPHEPAGRLLDLNRGDLQSALYWREHLTGAEVQAALTDDVDATVPGVACLTPRRGKLDLPAASFEAVADVETLSHAGDKRAWLAEIFRLLKPGGVFAGAAILNGGARTAWTDRDGRPALDEATFKALLERCGFAEIVLNDTTRPCWQQFSHKLGLFLWEQTIDGSFDGGMVDQAKTAVYGSLHPIHAHVLFRAVKPAAVT